MSRLVIVIVILFASFQISNAQINGLGNADNYEGINNLNDVKRNISFEQKTQNQMKKSKLNYYLDGDWQAGVFYTKSNTSINGFLYRYNIYTDQIELRSVIDHESMDIVSIGTRKFIFSQFLNEDSTMDEGYFELLVNGDCKLLIRRSLDYKEGNNDFAYGVPSSTAVVEKYYIKKNNEVAVIINKSKESIMNILSDKNDFVNYIDDKLLLIITEKKLMEIVNHYNKI
ncbi:MAG: hypothetical protein A2X13_01410 [Bacteroidetes bacterium GWC2_33_15]|nr:MAG: hypothetical protein A2X10_08215 [Bacteroidetes bacterium GWA2_33_15]OFX52142.1 MAG: hypothetical protein A2X13_01410 [Bacteroidetes bacterium GWC2_33_15]OFX64296.1 MAG: hypothetical protein A2X15_12230 [Bacteroidetes bacterium GWB2_32_14]OFX67701.1 MAG: hypothetical protein A2X14_06055 [Bacteroidetes bacterium GWD2_33_33]HAN19309.1 hypothetical protein [Bacteroidales bacterium]